ncbi:4'-phosphopantetheinyl transferase family protein [Rothia sp. CCM 9417]|uniref:4'-phosphopantetheinyl transferase family protein n=1 Tax=unclassified Rothia (in: high G+C Gram-positive bacteria) TaxID=2689056 RepID=UPI003ACB0190
MVHASIVDGASHTRLALFLMPPETLRSGHGVSWLAYVGMTEQKRAAEYASPEEAMSYAAQHTLMRCIAATVLGVRDAEASQIPVDRSCSLCLKSASHGKPRLEGVNLNMARALGLAAGVYSASDTALGIDLITVRDHYFDGFDRIALADYEKRVVDSLLPDQARLVRQMLWCAKEAVLKASGHGLSVKPNQVMLALPPLPTDIGSVHGLTAGAKAYLPEQAEAVPFWITWQVYEDTHLVAVASKGPHHLEAQKVTAPYMVKRALTPPL